MLEYWLAAVQRDGEDLRRVPETYKTPELCLEAVKQDGWALQYVPEALRTRELCLEAIGDAYRRELYRDERGNEWYEEWLDNYGWAMLEYVPQEHWRDKAFCLAAVQRCGYALSYVPEEMKTEGPGACEICLAAVRQDGDALRHVPETLRAQIAQAAGITFNDVAIINKTNKGY